MPSDQMPRNPALPLAGSPANDAAMRRRPFKELWGLIRRHPAVSAFIGFLGAVGGYKDLARFTTLGGTLFVFSLPET